MSARASMLLGALIALALVALVYKRRELAAIIRAQPLLALAATTLGVVALLLGRRSSSSSEAAPTPTPSRDLTPTPRVAPPPPPAKVDHAQDIPIDTVPDAEAPLTPAPDDDLGELVLRIEDRAARRTGTAR